MATFYNEKVSSKVGTAPIKSLSVFLSKPNLAIKVESTHKGYTGAFLTFKKLLSVGEVITSETSVKLNFAEVIQVPDGNNPYNLLIDFPAWLSDANVKIWEVLEMPQYPIFPVSTSRISVPIPPTTTVASATAVQIAPARSGRNRLSIYNNSNGNMYVRYAATGSGTSATTAAGGYDEIIAAGNVFEFPGNDFPETAINAIWGVNAGVTLSGSCTVSEGIRG